MTTLPPSWLLRGVRLLRPGGNPLSRGVDRAEAAVVIVCVLLALVLVPVMLTFGSLTYANRAERSELQARTRHETVAVLTEDAPEPKFGGNSTVAARWRLPNGVTRTGLVEAADGGKAGAEVRIWLDESGRPVAAPMSTVDYVGAAVLVAVFGWLFSAGLLALACWGLRHVLDRRRYRAWDLEWARVEPDWHDRSF